MGHRGYFDPAVVAPDQGPVCRDFRRALVCAPHKRRHKRIRAMLKYSLLGLAALYVAWNVFKAVMEWADRRKEDKA